MKPEDLGPRWLDPSSDASDELRELLRLTADDDPSAKELSGLDARISSLLGTEPSAIGRGSDAASAGFKATGFVTKFLAGVGILAIGAVWLAASQDGVRLDDGDSELPASVPARTIEFPLLSSEPKSAAPPVIASDHAERPARAQVGAKRADELELLRKGQLALRTGAFSDALELTAEHARAFPRSELGQERELIAIEALHRLGRASEALSRGERFVERFPGSAHARRVRSILGLGLDGGTE